MLYYINFKHVIFLIWMCNVFSNINFTYAKDESYGGNVKLNSTTWINGRLPKQKLNLISWLVDGCFYYEENSTHPDIPNCSFSLIVESAKDPPEFQSFDGFFNNIFETSLGAVDTPLLRRVPPVYDDGTYEPVKAHRINPFEASDKLMKRSPNCTNSDGKIVACGSKTGKSAFLVYFGQQVVEEILDAQRPGCPPEYFNIPIPEGHEFRTTHPQKSELPLLRSRYSQTTGHSPGNPRQQLNEITPWLDGGLIYGTAKAWADVLRTFPNGTLHPGGQLASDKDEGLFPAVNTLRLPMANPPPPAHHEQYVKEGETANVNRFFVLGNPRGNENAFLLAFGVVLFRWHNQFAIYLRETRPGWSGERVFQEARKWSIATYQQIVVYDWLLEWLSEPLSEYKGYNPSVHPQIEQFFQTAAMRFGHTLVTPGAYMREYNCGGCAPIPFYGLNMGGHRGDSNSPGLGAVRTCNIFWRSQEPLTMNHDPPECLKKEIDDDRNVADIDRLLMGMASQRAEREDNMIVEDLRGRVFGPLEFSRRDLMAINIQRGRDHGTPDYNTAREAFGLNRITSASQYVTDTNTATPLDIINTMVDIHTIKTEEDAWKNIDVWTGGILETSDRPGPLFRAIIKDQFSRIRDADRFWFENEKWKAPRFTTDQIKRIKTLKVFDLVVSVTRMTDADIQANPFRVPDFEFKSKCGNEDLNLWEESNCTRTQYDAEGIEILNETAPCFYFPQLDSSVTPVENCTIPGSFDYFTGSEASFILTFIFLGIVIIVIILSLKYIAARVEKNKLANKTEEMQFTTQRLTNRFSSSGFSAIAAAREWQGEQEGTRPVAILFIGTMIQVRNCRGELLREIVMAGRMSIDLIIVSDEKHLVLKIPSEYDLVLEFDGIFFRNVFLNSLTLQTLKMEPPPIINKEVVEDLKKALSNVITKQHRIARLEMFFRLAFSESEGINLNHEQIKEIQAMELSKAEFAEALGMDSSTGFVQNIFNHVAKYKEGHVNFHEFFFMLDMFKNGTAKDKAQYLFNVYDIGNKGFLKQDEIRDMFSSMTEASLGETSPEQTNELVTSMMSTLSLGPDTHISRKQFQTLFVSHKDTLRRSQLQSQYTSLNGNETNEPRPGPSTGRRLYGIENNRDRLTNLTESYNLDDTPPPPADSDIEISTLHKEEFPKHWLLTWFEIQRLHIFWLTMYILVALAIFAERAYHYSFEREQGGLRHIAGYGVSITRGAASVQMFCYSTLLLTMCRNTITYLRETFLRRFIPFDSFPWMHKFIAYFAIFFTILHVVGHGVNFYHISTQTPEDLTCLFRAYFRPTHKLPKFHYWMFGTVTGLSGVLLIILAAVIYTFASSYSRAHTFKAFWITHHAYPLWYALILLHGSGNLVQEPIFLNFLLAPLFLFIFDKLLSITTRNVEIPVFKADLLPSDVIMLKFGRPTAFEFKSGQWIYMACTALNPNEFHPFTISSAPHEKYLTVHIRAVGKFTKSIRKVFTDLDSDTPIPKLHIDGPYGEGHQEWHRYEISVLIGGGIGVTPFASILKDVDAQSNPRMCKKVYFIWVTRTQKQFEWFVDIIRNVESNKMISVHIFITQANNKFDLRTVLLYVCERNFQEINKRSLFTGLKSVTHFGRPDFTSLFLSLKQKHGNVSKFGVFTCGPPTLVKSVNDSCHHVNTTHRTNIEETFKFEHHFESF